jgi:hypothetical protein
LPALVALPTEAILRKALIRAGKTLDAVQTASIQPEPYAKWRLLHFLENLTKKFETTLDITQYIV